MITRPLPLLVVLLLAALPSCVTLAVDFGRPLPDDALLASIRPGETTRAELFDLLGPPDELLSPLVLGPGRVADPARRQVRVERQLFGRRVFSWEAERRRDAMLLIIPFVNLFEYWRTLHTRDRLVVELDEHDVVRQVAVRREFE